MACTCYNGCSACGAQCGSGCSGTCTTSCSGCWGSCSGCQGTCSGGCNTGCSSCSGSCSGGCSGRCSGCGGSCSVNCSGSDTGSTPTPTSSAYIAPFESSITTTKIGAYIEGLDPSYSYTGRNIEWYLNSSWYGTMTLDSCQSGSNVQTFSGLSPSTVYYIGAIITGIRTPSGIIEKTISTKSISTESLTITGNFQWTYAGYDPSNNLKQGLEKMPGYGYYVTASEWNRLITNVKSKLQARGLYSPENYPLTPAVTDNSFTSTQFNQVRKAIGSLASTGLADKERNDPIKANDLNLLMDRINTIS